MRPLVVGVLVAGACGASHELPPKDGPPPMIDAPMTDDGTGDAAWSWQSLISNSWSMIAPPTGTPAEAGISCSTLPITQEAWIDGFRPAGDMSPENDHQFLIVTSNPACSGDRLLGAGDELIYGVGLGSNGQLQLPAGTAVHVVPSTTTPLYFMLYDHIVNETTSKITGTSTIEVHYVDDPTTVAHDVDMVLGGGTFSMLPANDPSYAVNGPCAPTQSPGYQWHVVALWPHMHESGTHATVTIGATTILDTAYSYLQEQTYAIPDTLLDTNAELDVTCTLANAHPFTLSYDEVKPESEGFSVCWTGLYKCPTGTESEHGDGRLRTAPRPRVNGLN